MSEAGSGGSEAGSGGSEAGSGGSEAGGREAFTSAAAVTRIPSLAEFSMVHCEIET